MADAFVFFATDIHGSERCFRKWLNAAAGYGAGVLVLGGDITGKVIVPVQRRNGSHVARWRGSEHVLEGPSALAEFERAVADAGAYAWHAEPDEAEATFANDDASEALFARLAAERLADSDVKAYVIAGNDDPYDVDEVLSSGRALVNADARVVWIEDWLPMLSLGDSTPTPWKSPREVSEEEYAQRVARLADELQDTGSAIFNLHVPPYDSSLDLAPELDEELRIRYTMAGEPKQAPVGGRSVREAIERYQPLVGLHGHVHEGRGRAKIGRTVCFNPGSDYQQGVLRGVLLRVSPKKGVRDFTFTTG
ncbi:MAG TPA: hypothetical protein VNT23_04070 [Gaiellaceae bacterium]|nr:hypothetical protein [Gaiellaceae bacterium]